MTTRFSLRNKKIWVAGHNGMVGSALVRRLQSEQCEILTVNRRDLDLRDQAGVRAWMAANKPDAVILAAARVGGIVANRDSPADFLYDNLMIEANVINAAYEQRVQKLLFLGSSCIYPWDTAQPIDPSALMTGALEPTNESYALAKIAGIKLCQSYRRQHGCDFISAMPCNLYGPGDTYDAQNSHVIPALIMKLDEAARLHAPSVELWGTGNPLREFLHVDDLTDALVTLLQSYSGDEPVNVGSGNETNIRDLAHEIAAVVGYRGDIKFNPQMPDGTPRKILNSSVIRAMRWVPATGLRDGLNLSYKDYARSNRKSHGIAA